MQENKSRYLMQSMMTIINNTELNTGNLLREISGDLTPKKKTKKNGNCEENIC